MEAPQSAREFIKRFHLPQLVRISPPGVCPAQSDATAGRAGPSSFACTSNNEQRPAGQGRAENAGWTYAQPLGAAGPKSAQGSGERPTCGGRLRVPRAQLDQRGQSAWWSEEEEEEEGSRRGPGEDGAGAQLPAALQIKLTPPSSLPALSKLQLEQPFLLFKAYRKLELEAYAVDLKNELNEKSGDPIYFPHNYRGEFESGNLSLAHRGAGGGGGGGWRASCAKVYFAGPVRERGDHLLREKNRRNSLIAVRSGANSELGRRNGPPRAARAAASCCRWAPG